MHAGPWLLPHTRLKQLRVCGKSSRHILGHDCVTEIVPTLPSRLRVLSNCCRSLPFLTGFLVAGLVLAPASLNARVELQPCHNGIAPQQQIELGQKAAQQVYERMPVLPDNSPITQYVQSLGHKLAAYAPGYKWPFNFHVVNVADINAFALPGGSIFVNLGTIQAATNEAQLAAVMAHEISHVVLQHSVCNAEKEQRVGLIAGLGQLAAGAILGNTAGAVIGKGLGLTAGLDFLHMSRAAEQQADLMGVGILYDASYDPHAMPQFFETIEQKYGRGGAQFLADHPNPGNRTEYVGKEISTFVPRSNYVTNTPAFERIHQEVSGMRAYTAKEIASGVWKSQSPNQTVSTGVNQMGSSQNGGLAGTRDVAGADISRESEWKLFRGPNFSMKVPANWSVAGNGRAAIIAPHGGVTDTGNLVYGVLTDVYQSNQRTPLDRRFRGLLGELTHDNPGLQPGWIGTFRVNDVTAKSVESISSSADGGRGEHDWIVGFDANNGLRYFVFVSSSPDFARLRPTFEEMLRSIRFE
jgi:beta-barrel assembly-enhancing protease